MNDNNNNAYPPRYENVDLTPEKLEDIAINLHVIEEFRNAKRSQNGTNDSSYDAVFIWEVDEITWMGEEGTMDAYYIGDLELPDIRRLKTKILEKHGFDEKLEDNVVNIEDLVDDGTEEMKRLTTKYSLLEQFYNEISDGIMDNGPMINYELLEKCEMTNSASDLYIQAEMIQTIISNRWQYAKQSLELVNKRSAETGKKYANVVYCHEGVGSAMAQLLMSGHAKYIEVDKVYSTFKEGSEESVFKRIRKRFGEKCTYVVVTPGWKTRKMAKELNMLAWNSWSSNFIEQLYEAQRDTFLQ